MGLREDIIDILKEKGVCNVSQIHEELKKRGRGVAKMTLYKELERMKLEGVIRTYKFGNNRMVELVVKRYPIKTAIAGILLCISLFLYSGLSGSVKVHMFCKSDTVCCYQFDPFVTFLAFSLGLFLGVIVSEIDAIVNLVRK